MAADRFASVLKRSLLFLAPALMLVGCGSSSRPRPVICLLKAQAAIARDLKLGRDAIHYAKSEGSNGMPQCQFSARAGAYRVFVTVNVDDGPSAYFRLLRTVDEATQLFGPPPPGFHAPEQVPGLGPFASWFPTRSQLMATNDVDLLTVTITWPHAKRDPDVDLARAAIVPYLKHPHGRGSTNDYP